MTSKQRCARSVGSDEAGLNLTIDRTPDGLSEVGAFVDRIANVLDLDQRAEYALRLCLEEAVTNLVIHGQGAPGDAPDTVALHVISKSVRLCVAIDDHCVPFDPRDVPAPMHPPNVEAAKIGGLGIHLLRQYASALKYDRIGAINRLTITIERN